MLPTNLGVEPYHYGAIILGDFTQLRRCIRETRPLILPQGGGGSLTPLFHTTTEGGDERPSPWGGGGRGTEGRRDIYRQESLQCCLRWTTFACDCLDVYVGWLLIPTRRGVGGFKGLRQCADSYE